MIRKKVSRTATYLLPELSQHINIKPTEVIDLFLGVKGKTTNFNGTVIVHSSVIKDKERIESSRFWISTTLVDEGMLLEFMFPNPQLYNNFVNGNYSKFEKSEIDRILRYWGLDRTSNVFYVLTKHPKLKNKIEQDLGVSIGDQELGTRIDFNEELYG